MRHTASAPGQSFGGALIPAPLIIISRRRLITQREAITSVRVAIHSNVSNMAVNETNHIHCIIELPWLVEGRLPRVMPRVGKERGIICHQDSFVRLSN